MSIYQSLGWLALFYLLLALEFFLPTGGLLGIAAVGAAIASVVTAFSYSFTAGVVILGVLGITTPLTIAGLIHIWPKTRIGRLILNRRPGQLAPAAPPKTTPSGILYNDLIDQMGIAVTDLLPSGRIKMGAEKLDAISTGGPISSGDAVIVVDIQSGRIRVRAATERDEKLSGKSNNPNALESQNASLDDGDELSFDLESFE